MNITSYPLCYPSYKTRTQFPIRSNFSTSLKVARDGIYHELKQVGVPSWDVIISSNVELQKNNTGLMKATYPKLEDHGAAVYFTLNDRRYVFCCDAWDKIECNLQAIRKTIEAVRKVEAWKASTSIENLSSFLLRENNEE